MEFGRLLAQRMKIVNVANVTNETKGWRMIQLKLVS
jgi:hypothetical protein